jgi:hypothetical protein
MNSEPTRDTVNVNVRIPAPLHGAIKQKAEAEHRSLNGQILACLERCLNAPAAVAETPAGYGSSPDPQTAGIDRTETDRDTDTADRR